MKKWLLMSLVAVLVLALAACGGDKKEEASAPAAEGDGGYTKEKPLVIKFSHVTSIDSVKGKAADEFAKLVATKQKVK